MDSEPIYATTSDGRPSVTFSFFVSLLRELSRITPLPAGALTRRNKQKHKDVIIHDYDYPARSTFRKWCTRLKGVANPLPPGTTAIIFRFLFPEQDIARKYGLQEAMLGRHLASIFAISTEYGNRGAFLRHWMDEATNGCLGSELRAVLSDVSPDLDGSIGLLTIHEVDDLLTELAALNAFSSRTIRASFRDIPKRNQRVILSDLFRPLPAMDAGFLTQIILKDLRPILYPIGARDTYTALLEFKSNAVYMLSMDDAMREWEPGLDQRMLQTFRARATIEDTAAFIEHASGDKAALPVVGIPIQIPKCEKGRGCKIALERLAKRADLVWAETKYDGERAQIHVQANAQGGVDITIYSKSGRDSTRDRHGVHHIIREALGFPSDLEAGDSSRVRLKPNIECNIVLEAEMVAFSDEENRIDEFWRIRSLIESTAHGVRGKRIRQPLLHEATQNSLVSDASDGGTRHLALVFFDVLVLDSKSYLFEPYRTRRELLQSVITVISGRAMLSQRVSIPVTDSLNTTDAQRTLRRLLATHIADYEEGLILKADLSFYRDTLRPWVKVKKDYIEGYGDCLDLAVVGAGWDKERGRELRVAPNTFTTFYLGALSNSDELDRGPFARPHFEVYFTVSYGPNRGALEGANNIVQRSAHTSYADVVKRHGHLPYDFMLGHGVATPHIMLHEPLLAEVFGAGFTKADEAKFYELRWPRMTKLHRRAERGWREGATLQKVQRIAHEVVGRPSAEDDARNCVSGIWGKPMIDVPGLRTPQKRAATIHTWIAKLEARDDVEEANKDTEYKGNSSSDVSFEVQRAWRPAGLGHKPLHSMTNVAQEITLAPSSYMHLPTPPSQPSPRKRRRSGSENAKIEEPFSPQPTLRRTKKRRITPGPETTLHKKLTADDMSDASEETFSRHLEASSSLTLRRQPTEVTAVSSMPSSRHSPPLSRPAPSVPTSDRLPEPVPSVVFTPSTPFPQLRSIYFKDVTERLDKPKIVMKDIEPIIQYFKESFVWLGVPSDIAEKPSWMRTISDFIPESLHFTNLDAMFDACGWGPTDSTPPTDIRRGLIIVDRQPRVIAQWRPQKWEEHEEYARMMLEERKNVPGGLPPGERRPISLVDICLLSVHAAEVHHEKYLDYVYMTVK